MYSPKLMEESGEKPDISSLESRVTELENLADNLRNVPDEELVAELGRAVELLKEVNTGIESGVQSLGKESRQIEELLDPLDPGDFDEALEEIAERRDTGEQNP